MQQIKKILIGWGEANELCLFFNKVCILGAAFSRKPKPITKYDLLEKVVFYSDLGLVRSCRIRVEKYNHII